MFSRMKRSKALSGTFGSTRLYDERMFYQAFIQDLRLAQHEVIIESPYLTCRRANELSPIFKKLIKKGVKVRLNTRFPGHHDEYLRIQAWTALKNLKAIGVQVKLCNDYRHRKLAIIDETVLWEGSLNIMSQNNSREVMRRTNSEPMCKQMIAFTKLNRKFW
jgi:phosphatidylserine/phosphatidylglycerophosphate/cardiolipin synthase-like enzyme